MMDAPESLNSSEPIWMEKPFSSGSVGKSCWLELLAAERTMPGVVRDSSSRSNLLKSKEASDWTERLDEVREPSRLGGSNVPLWPTSSDCAKPDRGFPFCGVLPEKVEDLFWGEGSPADALVDMIYDRFPKAFQSTRDTFLLNNDTKIFQHAWRLRYNIQRFHIFTWQNCCGAILEVCWVERNGIAWSLNSTGGKKSCGGNNYEVILLSSMATSPAAVIYEDPVVDCGWCWQSAAGGWDLWRDSLSVGRI